MISPITISFDGDVATARDTDGHEVVIEMADLSPETTTIDIIAAVFDLFLGVYADFLGGSGDEW